MITNQSQDLMPKQPPKAWAHKTAKVSAPFTLRVKRLPAGKYRNGQGNLIQPAV